MYKTYVEALFPQAKRPRAPKSSKAGSEKDSAAAASLSGSEAVATGADKGYDESWIPADHINRPSAKRVKSGASASSGKPKKAGE